MTFGQRLKNLRLNKGITQKQLGDMLDISDRVIGYYESDDRFPKDDQTLIKLAEIFGCTLDYLLGRNDKIETIAAHHDNDEWTDEELADIEKFKEFIRMKKKNKRH